MLVADGIFDAAGVLRDFLGRSREIDSVVVGVVEARLKEVPDASTSNDKGGATDTPTAEGWFRSLKRLVLFFLQRG